MTSKHTVTIDPDHRCLTLINLYDVEPDRQADLARLLAQVTESVIRHEPGFVSVSIHRSADGHRVANYAQWASKDHFEAFMRKPETQETLKAFASLAKAVSPGLYTVASVHAAG